MAELATVEDAVARVNSGDTVMIGGWGGVGVPRRLISALAAREVDNLTIVTNNCGTGTDDDVGLLFASGRVSRVVASFPSHPAATDFRQRLASGELELELVPQGTLVERIRCAGVGLGGFYTPTAVGTLLADGKESRVLFGREQVLEEALHADVALVHAARTDRYGNAWYRYVGRAFNALMAMAARTTLIETEELVDAIPPDSVHTPSLVVDVVVAPKEQE